MKLHEKFIQAFMDEKTSQYQRLIAPIGFGKSALAVKVVKEIAQTPNLQILFLLPTQAIVEQYRYLLNSEGPNILVEVVDMRRFRELLTRADLDKSPWPSNAVILLTLDTVKSSQVFEYIMKTEWDLIVADSISDRQVSLLSPVQVESVSILEFFLDKKNAKRILILDSVEQNRSQKGYKNKLREVMTTRWSFKHSNFKDIELSLHTLSYLRSPEEVAFIRSYLQLQKQAKNTSYAPAFRLRLVSSSLYAAEQSLQQLRNRVVHEDTLSFLDAGDETRLQDDLLEDTDFIVRQKKNKDLDPTLFAKSVQTLLAKFNQITTDRKLDVFLEYAKNLPENRRVMVFSSYAATISYLYSSISEQKENVYQLLNWSTFDNQSQMKRFIKDGGILISSTSSIIGTNIELDEIVFYDTLSNPIAIQQLIGRLFRNNKLAETEKTPIQKNIGAFRDESNIIPTENKRLKLLQEVLLKLRGDSPDAPDEYVSVQ